MEELEHLNNTVGKYISALKTFMRWAAKRGYHENYIFEQFKAYREEADVVYLTDEELTTLYELDLSNRTSLEQVRDVFCLGCYTGLRFSDIAALRPENIVKGEIHLTTYKTKQVLSIPLTLKATEIIKKYIDSPSFLPIISNQKTNDYLKVLGEIAGIDEPIIKTRFRGAERVEETHPKHQLLTTHTARRTFITLSLEKGMRAETVMKISGHKDYKTFKKYIAISEKMKRVEMAVWDKETPANLRIA